MTIPAVIEHFTALFAGSLDKRKKKLIPFMLSSLLLCRNLRSYAAMSEAIVTQRRNRASICKFYKRERFHSRDMYQNALDAVMADEAIVSSKEAKGKTWVLCIDGVCSKRGGFSKIENAIKYKKKTKDKGRSTKAHTFIQGCLITDKGVRLPLARRTFYTRSYCRRHKRKYVKMTKLAELIIDIAVIPEGVSVVVVADEFFEGQTLDGVCRKRGYFYISPADNRRCFEKPNGTRSSQHLHERGLSLNRSELTGIVLTPYQEGTALLRRRTGKDKHKRYYFAFSEIRDVAKLGSVRVTYSWKTHSRKERLSRKRFKVLVSNANHWTVRQIVEYYELRWQIEIFFRELKSFLGLVDFTGQDFQAYERYFDMVLLEYLFLEWYRCVSLNAARSNRVKGTLKTARTLVILKLFKQEVDRETIAYIGSNFRKRKHAGVAAALRQ